MMYLVLELVFHRITVSGRTVSEVTWRRTRTSADVEEACTVLAGPLLPQLSLRNRQQPSAIVWTESDGRQHHISFQWFRRRDAYAMIAAIQAA